MSARLRIAVAWLAYHAGLNLNYVFAPRHTWALGQPLFRRDVGE